MVAGNKLRYSLVLFNLYSHFSSRRKVAEKKSRRGKNFPEWPLSALARKRLLARHILLRRSVGPFLSQPRARKASPPKADPPLAENSDEIISKRRGLNQKPNKRNPTSFPNPRLCRF